jgi:dephospho-CoA kinase
LDLGLKVLGLTGGIGMGKSTAAALLAERDVTIVDTDLLARQLVEPGQPALAEIQDAFGPDIIAPDGRLWRDRLARLIFSNPAAREKLQGILHPRIRQLWQSQLADWRSTFRTSPSGQSSASLPLEERAECYFCVVIPLLFETGAEKEVQTTICVACSAATQHQRLAAREWTAEQIDQRIKSQLPVEEKMGRADYVIWNEGSLEILAAQIDRLLHRSSSEHH